MKRFLFKSIVLLSIVTTQLARADITFSEFHYDNAGADADEAVEVFGPVGTVLDGWQIVLYNGNGGASYKTIDLSGTLEATSTCNEGGVYVAIAEGMQNGAPDGIALIDPSNNVIEFISYEGVFDATDGPAAGMSSTDVGVAETSSTPIGYSLQKDLTSDIWQPPEENTFGGCALEDEPPPPPTPTPVPTEITFIHTIQGSGTEVTTNNAVLVEAVVIGDFQNSDELSGFFIQEEDSDRDSSNDTSEGIFVYCGSCSVDVAVGDLVQVVGLPQDYYENSQISATGETDIKIIAQNQPQPSAEIITMPIAVDAQLDINQGINAFYEKYEGMLVTIAGESVVSEISDLGAYGEILLASGERPRQFTDVSTASEQGFIDHNNALAKRVIVLDDGSTERNLPLTRIPSPTLRQDNYIRTGDTINNLTGPLIYSFSSWKIQPVKEWFDYSFTSANPRTQLPQTDLANLTVASFNVLNYFTTLDQNGNKCAPNLNLDCRGANTAEEFIRQQEKIVQALCKLDADIIGLMEIENANSSMSKTPLDDLVEQLNSSCPSYAAIATGPVGSDAITVAIIYRDNTVAPLNQTAILNSPEFLDPFNSGTDKNRPAVAQTFTHLQTNDYITVVVNHLKSRRSGCGDDVDIFGQGNCNLTRAAAAKALTDWLAADQSQSISDKILVIGDLNAYRKEDPVQTLVDWGLVDLVDQYVGAEAYSYVYQGQTGYLDHALATPLLSEQVVNVEEWHINADESILFDYNSENKPDNYLSELYAANPYRSSDHDPVIVQLLMQKQFILPSCDGKTATIYVNDEGNIVGGPLQGKKYNGVLPGTNGDDVIVGTAARDTILARSGKDLVCAGDGNDKVIQTLGDATIFGEAGDDELIGGPGNDKMFGGPGKDKLFGGLGEDLLDGGEDRDLSIGGFGKDECINSETALGC